MSGLEARIAEVLAAHSVGAFSGDSTGCKCDRTWRKNADYRQHVTEALAAMLAPLIREREAEAFKRGFDDAHNQHTAHRERRNLPHPGIAYTNPYRSNDE